MHTDHNNRNHRAVPPPTRPDQVLLIGLVWCGLLGLGLLLGVRIGYSQPVPQQGDHAGLVVQFGDGRIITECVKLEEKGWSNAEELLIAASLDVDIAVVPGSASSVCQIDTEGCNTDPDEGDTRQCFCQCPDANSCQRWLYYAFEQGIWQRALHWESMIKPGHVVGWAWGDQDTTRISKSFAFEEICPATTPTPTGTLTSTATVTSTASTLTPTATASPTSMATVTPTSTMTSTATITPTLTTTPEAHTGAPRQPRRQRRRMTQVPRQPAVLRLRQQQHPR
ncbi:MAG: hypothetical protein HC837_14930 [Chloroflexaceae bacterium]|nr:hypothetical protein [Chloroflexaceae bacterium]